MFSHILRFALGLFWGQRWRIWINFWYYTHEKSGSPASEWKIEDTELILNFYNGLVTDDLIENVVSQQGGVCKEFP